MKTLHDLAPRIRDVLRPCAEALDSRGVAPTGILLSSLGVAVLSGLLVAMFWDARPPLLVLASAWIGRLALATIADLLAHEHGLDSPSARLLGSLVDVASDLIMLLPLMLVPEFSPFLVTLVAIMAVLTEVAGTAATAIGVTCRHDGPLGQTERAIAMAVLALLVGLGVTPAVFVNLVLAVLVGLGFLTILNRVNGALEAHAALAEQGEKKAPRSQPPV